MVSPPEPSNPVRSPRSGWQQYAWSGKVRAHELLLKREPSPRGWATRRFVALAMPYGAALA